MEIVIVLLIGATAGRLGSIIYKDSGLGQMGNIFIGILGSMIGYLMLGKFGINLGSGWPGNIITGVVGAIVILFILNIVFVKRTRKIS